MGQGGKFPFRERTEASFLVLLSHCSIQPKLSLIPQKASSVQHRSSHRALEVASWTSISPDADEVIPKLSWDLKNTK